MSRLAPPGEQSALISHGEVSFNLGGVVLAILGGLLYEIDRELTCLVVFGVGALSMVCWMALACKIGWMFEGERSAYEKRLATMESFVESKLEQNEEVEFVLDDDIVDGVLELP